MPRTPHSDVVGLVESRDGESRLAPTRYRALLRRYASYAPTYDRRFARYTAATLAKTLELLPDHSRSMLDVACGTGTLLVMARSVQSHLALMGVDLSPDMLEKARRRIPAAEHVRWVQGSAELLPAADAWFDVLTCTNAFHLVQDSSAALTEFHRVLQPGGTLVIVDWCMDFPAMRLLAAWLRLADRQSRNLRTLDQMTSLLRSSNFDVKRAERFRATRLWGLMAIVAEPSRPATQRRLGESPTVA